MTQPTAKSVLLIGNFLSAHGGSRGVCEELAPRLADASWHVFTSSTRSGKIARLMDMVQTAIRQHRHYKVAQIDVYSGAAFIWAEVVCWILKLLRKPYILTLHGGNLPSFAAKYPRRVRRFLRSASTITVPSAYLHEQMRPYSDNLTLLPNSIEISDYPFRVRQTAKPHLIWLRAFHHIYNPVMAIQAVELLAKEFPEIHLSMVGPDKRDGSLEKCRLVVKENKLDDRLVFAGGVSKSEVPNWLQRGDIFLNTTNFDNTPISVIEAMTCGLCVVTTSAGGIPYLFTHEHDALLVPPEDPQAMADAVRRILTEQGLAGHLSRNARATVEPFDWSKILPQWEQLLINAIVGR